MRNSLWKKSFGLKYGQDLKKLNFMENDHTKPSWNKGPKQANKQLYGHTGIFFSKDNITLSIIPNT